MMYILSLIFKSKLISSTLYSFNIFNLASVTFAFTSNTNSLAVLSLKAYACATATDGGTHLNLVSTSENLIDAREKSLNNIIKIDWCDGFFRKDIGWRAINDKKL